MEIKKRKNEKRKKGNELGRRPEPIETNTSPAPVQTKISTAPPYGCLKNGTKPTYSQYKKTLKVREKISFPQESIVPNLSTKREIHAKINLQNLKNDWLLLKKQTNSTVSFG